jgi:SPP1 family predicted phage head-tail adaptor
VNPAAGQLRHRVEVQEDRGEANEFNETETTLRTVAHRWAEILPQSGTDTLVQDQRRQAVKHKLRIRYMPGLTCRHVLKLRDGRILHVTAVLDEGGRKRWHVLDCEERVGA